MKKIAITSAVAVLTIATSASAFKGFNFFSDNKKEITSMEVMATSTLSGIQGRFIRSVGKLTEENAGIKIQPKVSSGCGETVKYFHDAKDPIGIVWSSSMYRNSKRKKQNCVIDFNDATPVLVTYAPYEICVRKGLTLEPNKEYTFGSGRFMPQASIIEYLNGNAQNIKFKTVTYKSSGKVAAGLANSEVDAGIIATASAAKGVKAGSIACPYSTGSDRFGQKPLKTFAGDKPIANFKLGMMLFVRNMDADQIKKLQESTKDLNALLTPQEMVDTAVGVTPEMLQEYVDFAKLQLQWK